MIKSLLCGKQKSFKEKFIKAASDSGWDKKSSLDMTQSVICILSKILHRLYYDFTNSEFNEKAAKSVATIASIIVLSLERELEVFGVILDPEQAVLTTSILVLTRVFKKNSIDAEAYCKYGINSYKVILSNYSKSEKVKSYFDDVHTMTINFIEYHDERNIEAYRYLIIK